MPATRTPLKPRKAILQVEQLEQKVLLSHTGLNQLTPANVKLTTADTSQTRTVQSTSNGTLSTQSSNDYKQYAGSYSGSFAGTVNSQRISGKVKFRIKGNKLYLSKPVRMKLTINKNGYTEGTISKGDLKGAKFRAYANPRKNLYLGDFSIDNSEAQGQGTWRAFRSKGSSGSGSSGKKAKIKIKNSKLLSSKAKKVLQALLKKAGLKSAKVTRSEVSSAEQASDMYDLIKRKGVKGAFKLYGKTGDKVVKVYKKNKKLSKNKIINKMKKKINKLSKKNGCAVTHHHKKCKKYDTFDVAPSSIKNKKKFEKALKKFKKNDKIFKYHTPPDDPAYHIEIKVK